MDFLIIFNFQGKQNDSFFELLYDTEINSKPGILIHFDAPFFNNVLSRFEKLVSIASEAVASKTPISCDEIFEKLQPTVFVVYDRAWKNSKENPLLTFDIIQKTTQDNLHNPAFDKFDSPKIKKMSQKELRKAMNDLIVN